ncbi:MAG: Ig-like domain-containing protein [Candidatus Neomarinimicrobiota bacterium]
MPSFFPIPSARLRLLILTTMVATIAGCNAPEEGDSTSPFVRFTFPAEFTVLSDIVPVRVEARDNRGISTVTFLAEGDSLGVDTDEPYSLLWNTTAYPDCTDANSSVLLTAIAEDFAGNTRAASRQYFLDNEGLPPLQVDLFEPTDVTKHAVTVAWQRSVDYDFSHYLIRRDTNDDVTATSDSLPRIDDPAVTGFTDAGVGVSPFGLLEDTDYYYRLWVYDTFGRSRASDSVATARTLLPQVVPLRATELVTKYIAQLEWDLSPEDVAFYRLHRGPSPLLADLDSIGGFPPAVSSVIDSGLTASTTYYYYLYVIDSAGYTNPFFAGDALELLTDSLPAPALTDPPTAITKYSLTLAWAPIPDQEDSSWVALYRGTTPAVDTTDVRLYSAPRNQDFTITDGQLSQGQTYSFRLRHWDSQDNSAWSNTVTMTTLSLEDVWRGGLGVSEQGKYHLALAWDAYSYSAHNDFDGFVLSRDGAEVFAPSAAGRNSYTDPGLTKNTLYQYRLEVADTSGVTLAVTLEASTRDILPANIVLLEPTLQWFFDLAWLPSTEPADQFDHYAVLRTSTENILFVDDDGDDQADCLASGDCVQLTTLTQRLPVDPDTTLTYADTDTNLVAIDSLSLPIYSYVVLTYDQLGQYVASNIVGDTLYSPPAPVLLSGPDEHGSVSRTSILLQWTRASWPSPGLEAGMFARYEVWRYGSSGLRPYDEGDTDKLIHTSDLIDATSFSDATSDVQQGARWFYVVIVRDAFGQAAVSNEVEGFTSP